MSRMCSSFKFLYIIWSSVKRFIDFNDSNDPNAMTGDLICIFRDSTQIKVDRLERIGPHLIFSIISSDNDFNFRQLSDNNLEAKLKSTSNTSLDSSITFNAFNL